MKLQSMLRNIGSNSLAGILVLLLFPAVTEADGDLSLNPNPPGACETLTVQWPPTAAQFYCVAIVDQSDGQILFQTNITGPTTSVEWPVIATNGASLHFAIHTPPHLSSQPYEATDFHVHSGSTPCPTSDPPTATTTAPSNSTTISSTQPLSSMPASSAASTSATATPSSAASTSATATVASQTSTAAITSSTPSTTAGASTASFTSTSDSQLQSGTSGDIPNSGPSASTQISSSAHSSSASSPDTSSSPSRTLNSGAIAGVVVGSLAGIALVVLALYLCRRRARRRIGVRAVSPFPSHIDSWLPRTSRSSYQAHHGSRNSNPPPGAPSSDVADGENDRSKAAVYEQVHTRATSSLVARASSTDPSSLDRVAHVPHLRRGECVDGLVTSEKLFREQRNRTAPTSASGEADTGRQTDAAVEEPVSSSQEGSDVFTLPPAYSSHFGET